jgi:amino acid permease
MTKTKHKATEVFVYALIAVLVVAVIGLSIFSEVEIWEECRSDHSFLYCWRVLGSR